MRRRPMPAARLSNKERIIVRYITERLEMAYRDANGKAVYARSMDQVMNDIFGMKKFTKTLTRARYNEGLMINLMKTLDTETLWRITRSKEHYRLLCTLVAMDHYIVKLGKKYNRMAETDLAERPTAKMRKIAKEIKRCKKMYRSCVKAFRGIFNIEKIDDRKNGIFDSLEDWLERHDGSDDIFYGYGDYYDDSAIESMDEYIASHGRSKKSRSRRPSDSEGALGILGDSFMDEGYDYDGDDDEEEDDDETEYLIRKVAERLGVRTDDDDDRRRDYSYGESEDSSLERSIARLADVMTDGFTQLNQSIGNLYDVMTEEDEDEEDDGTEDVQYQIPRPTGNRYRPASSGTGDIPPDGGMTISAMIQMSEDSAKSPPASGIVVDINGDDKDGEDPPKT